MTRREACSTRLGNYTLYEIGSPTSLSSPQQAAFYNVCRPAHLAPDVCSNTGFEPTVIHALIVEMVLEWTDEHAIMHG